MTRCVVIPGRGVVVLMLDDATTSFTPAAGRKIAEAILAACDKAEAREVPA